MTSQTITTMLAVAAFVWGGFSLVLVKAIRAESAKATD